MNALEGEHLRNQRVSVSEVTWIDEVVNTTFLQSFFSFWSRQVTWKNYYFIKRIWNEMKKIKKSKKSRIHVFQFDIKGIDDKLRTDCWEWVTLTKELTIGWIETVLISPADPLILVPLWLQNHAFLFNLYQTFDCSKFKN